MSAYWWGLLTLPIVGVAAYASSLFIRLIAYSTSMLPGTFQRVTKDTDERRRAVYGSIVYAATRCYWFGFGEVGIALVIGQDGRDRGEAFNRLYAPGAVRINPDFFASHEPTEESR